MSTQIIEQTLTAISETGETYFHFFTFLSGKHKRKPGELFSPSLSFLILCSPFLVLVPRLGSLFSFPALVPCLLSLSWFPELFPCLCSLSWFPVLDSCLCAVSWFPVFIPCNCCRSAPMGVEPQTRTRPSG